MSVSNSLGRKGHSLIFSQILIELHVAPDLAAVVNGVNVKLSVLDRREVKMPKHAGGAKDEGSQRSVGRGQAQESRDGEVGHGISEDEGVV